MENKEITINGIVYVPKSDILIQAEKMDGKEYCIIRTQSAGVFVGYIDKQIGQEVDILKVRRIWYWAGANSLSQLAVDGTLKPNDCKFSCEVEKEKVFEVIEILNCTQKAKNNIEEVKPWILK